MAARCPRGARSSPHRKRLHVRSKRLDVQEETSLRPVSVPGTSKGGSIARQDPIFPRNYCISKASISLSLSPEIAKVRNDLAKVAVLSIVEGYVNETSVLEVVPTVLNCMLAGPITPLNECSFLVPLGSRDEVKTVCKLGSFKVATKDGPCTLNIAPWSADLGADGRASGDGQWALIWNLPLHGWCWEIIVEVLKPVGELIILSQASVPHKRFISALIRRRRGVELPMEVECNLGMRRYKVLITSDKGEFPKFSKALGRYFWPIDDDVAEPLIPVGGRGTHNIPPGAKGKTKLTGFLLPWCGNRRLSLAPPTRLTR